jgi:hypothetical protein
MLIVGYGSRQADLALLVKSNAAFIWIEDPNQRFLKQTPLLLIS